MVHTQDALAQPLVVNGGVVRAAKLGINLPYIFHSLFILFDGYVPIRAEYV